MGLAGQIRYADLTFTEPRYGRARIVSVYVSSHAKE